MGGENKHLGNLYVGWSLNGIKGGVGDVFAREWRYALVYVLGTFRVAMEADFAEARLHESGFEKRNPYGGVGHVNPQAVGDALHGCLCSAIDVAVGICCVTGHGADVYHVSFSPLWRGSCRAVP